MIFWLLITPCLSQSKERIAFNLSIPAAACVVRHDTQHPAFHGCLDWHSAVNGTWALVAYTHMTGDERYLPLIQEILTPENMAVERRYLQEHPDFEMPYGRAWLLRLAIEAGTFDDFADEVAESLLAYYQEHGVDPSADEYDNAAWALINLLDYAHKRQNSVLIQSVHALVPIHKVPSPHERPGFMSTHLNWAWLMSKILSREEFISWLAGFLPELPVSIQKPLTTHHYGLNFSRSWGLWALYKATGDRKYADLYADHFWAGYRDPQHWSGDYDTVGHWVAHFGMLALQQAW